MFSLCIATMDRFDEFLSRSLPRYLAMDLVSEIIVTDENGRDAAKIHAAFPDHPKLRLYVNNHKLGPFLNKRAACSLARCEWIALIDSDNFADADYFQVAKNYIETVVPRDQKNVILSPSENNYKFHIIAGEIIRRGEVSKILALYEQRKGLEQYKCDNLGHPSTLMDTGNYVINKFLVDNVDLSAEPYTTNCHSCDVVYFNTILFEQLDLQFHIVPGMKYQHVVHPGSVYLTMRDACRGVSDEVHAKFDRISGK